MVFIPVYGRGRVLRGYTAVDERDAELVRELRMHMIGLYVCASLRGERCLLHRLLTDAEPGYEVHHINGNPLDNRRENLEVLTPEAHRARHGGRSWEHAAD